MSFSVGDSISVKDKKGSKTVSPSIGDKIISEGGYGRRSSSFSVGSRIYVAPSICKKYGYKSGTVVPAISFDRWSGYGEFVWQHICTKVSSIKEDLGIWVVKRENNTENLSINEIWQIPADDVDVTYNPALGTYTWNETLLSDAHANIGIMATDTDTYMFNSNTIYNFDTATGAYSVKGTIPAGSLVLAFDGSNIFARSEGHIYKIRFSDLTVTATLTEGYPIDYAPPIFISGSSVWFTRYAAGGGTGNGRMTEYNYSDLTPTGNYYEEAIYGIYYSPQDNSSSGIKFWYNGYSDSKILPGVNWRTWDISSGAVSDTIIPDSPY
jgi:hypothetical protein